ncbi:MAG: helicase C-terminal domain-containing protein [archaeon]
MSIRMSEFPYENIRDAQKEILEKLQENWDKYRYFVLEAPTGVGKSAIAKTIAASNRNAFLITATKQLQDQYVVDFPDGGIQSIKGRANYTCAYNDRLNCEVGPCMVNKDIYKECKGENICPYYTKRDKALKANIALTSYAYFLRAMDCAGFWKSRDILILDECHLLESQITQWASVFLSPRELNLKYNIFSDVGFDKFTYLTAPPEQSGYEANEKWLSTIWDLIVKKRNELYKDLEGVLNGKKPDELTEDDLDELASGHKDYYDIDKLFKKVNAFFEASDKDGWLIEPEEDGLTISPVNVGNLFKFYMDEWADKKVIFMSATILDVAGFCNEIGLPKEETGIIRVNPTFDPKKSPIVYNPVGAMNYANIDNTLPKIVKEVDKILDLHPNEKGIIHTGNYKIAEFIHEQAKSNRVIMKEEEETNEQLMYRHMNSKKPTVLVSPSLTTGADLKDELSRFQIIVKLPWVSLADKRVKKKIEQSDTWYAAEMFRSFVQACGRSTRSKDDWSTTYVFDNSFYKWIYKYRHWFPKQFHDRIIWKKDKYFKSKRG